MDAFWVGVFVIETASAVLLHETILKRKEIDHLTPQLLAISTVAFWLTVYYSSFLFATLAASAFFIPLSLCILLYRAFFHPLKHFPGPFGARLSKWWTVKQVIDTNWRLYRVHLELQKKYGDYVRTGPRELTIFDPAAIQPLLGLNSMTTKGPWYDIMDKSLHLTRDHAFHRQRRKVWDNALKECMYLLQILQTKPILTAGSFVGLCTANRRIHLAANFAPSRGRRKAIADARILYLL